MHSSPLPLLATPMKLRLIFALATPIILFASALTMAGEATERAKSLGIPTLDEMGGEWTPMDRMENPPSLHNNRYMLISDWDLTSYFFSPHGWLYNLANYADQTDPVLWKRGYPAVKMLIDDVEYKAREARQGNYRVLRRNNDCNGLAVETDTRLVHEQRGVLSNITFKNTTLLTRTFEVALSMPGSLQADGIGVANTFQRAGNISIIRPTRKPDHVEIDAYIVAIWKWKVTLKPGETWDVGFAAGDDEIKTDGTDGFIQGDIGNQKGEKTDARVAGWVAGFDKELNSAREVWEKRWADAFTPNNGYFSGNVPVLKSSDAALKRNYYMGIYTFLCTERTNLALHPRSFITNGERDDGTQFYTDIAGASPAWILLEPEGTKVTLRRWLTPKHPQRSVDRPAPNQGLRQAPIGPNLWLRLQRLSVSARGG